jgi:uncharacterized protein YkwD
MFKTLIVVVCGILFSAVFLSANAQAKTLVAPKKVCPNQFELAINKKEKQMLNSMFCLTNYARKQKGLKPYRLNNRLKWSSKKKASDIVRCQQFSHTACGKPFEFWIKKSQYTNLSSRYSSWRAGENIAMGNSYLGTPNSMFKAWLNSPSHRAAILSKNYVDIGIGVRKASVFNKTKNMMIWVQHFGHQIKR